MYYSLGYRLFLPWSLNFVMNKIEDNPLCAIFASNGNT